MYLLLSPHLFVVETWIVLVELKFGEAEFGGVHGGQLSGRGLQLRHALFLCVSDEARGFEQLEEFHLLQLLRIIRLILLLHLLFLGPRSRDFCWVRLLDAGEDGVGGCVLEQNPLPILKQLFIPLLRVI